jgi:hypothetical protein
MNGFFVLENLRLKEVSIIVLLLVDKFHNLIFGLKNPEIVIIDMNSRRNNI